MFAGSGPAAAAGNSAAAAGKSAAGATQLETASDTAIAAQTDVRFLMVIGSLDSWRIHRLLDEKGQEEVVVSCEFSPVSRGSSLKWCPEVALYFTAGPYRPACERNCDGGFGQ
ncbi:hypothetical protein GCM10009765_04620 [Fodinicola feengrottensis]|uniref:Uncharacterized protein n=1 Tax=Fodinicola feengrottensis TaxID=435914 RepID=A0ABP4RNP1_9ACTN